jgi:hypothetical protein
MHACRALLRCRWLPAPLPPQEERAKEQVVSLKAEVAHLNKLIEQGAGMGAAEERTLAELMAQKEEVARERDAQVGAWAGRAAEVPCGGGGSSGGGMVLWSARWYRRAVLSERCLLVLLFDQATPGGGGPSRRAAGGRP